MIDAYTIGITLALEDGVSEGILQIRRDLEALDVAVADSAGRLMMLRNLARELALPALSVQSTEQAAIVPSPAYRPQVLPAASSEAPVPVAPIAAPHHDDEKPQQVVKYAISSPADPMPVTGASGKNDSQAPPAPALAPAVTLRTAPPASPTQPAVPVLQPAPPLPMQHTLTELVERPRPVDLATIGRSVSPSVAPPPPIVPKQDDDRAIDGVTSEPPISVRGRGPAEPSPPSRGMSAAPAPPIPLPEASRDTASPQLPVPHAPEQQRGDRQHAAVAPLPLAPDSNGITAAPRLPAAPVVKVEVAPGRRLEERVEPRQPTPGVVEAPAQPVDRPVFAELHLDGATLGRWVTRHLERQVTRPQAGATGFDARMTPTWPGAPIGN